MRSFTLTMFSRALALAMLMLALPGVFSPTPASAEIEVAKPEIAAADVESFYSYEELAALDAALWAGNMTREDLKFKKDYGKGYECFPIVREMMADPLSIGPWLEAYTTTREQNERFRTSNVVSLELAATSVFGDVIDIWQLYDGSWRPVNTDHEVSAGSWLADIAARAAVLAGPDEPELRAALATAMAWHPVDGTATSSDTEVLKSLYDGMTHSGSAKGSSVAYAYLTGGAQWLFEQLRQHPELIPNDRPAILESEYGRVAIGTLGDDTYTGDFAALLEPGGNDHYVNCRIGAAYGKATTELGNGKASLFADLGGNDVYDCADVDITLGAAVLGVAAFYDLGSGNDRYYGGNFSLGATAGGIATFYDDGGSDYYSGKVYTQGAAGFGIAIMLDDSVQPALVIPTDVETPDPIDLAAFDNDVYVAWSEAQAFARTRGIAICSNRRGNETYQAGGVYLHAPLFSDRYQSFSQGFAIGERDIDYAGGIALLADYGGNDRYLGDIYNQGVGYWYSAGFLYDGGGNDLYEMTQYGQGSGIHLAVGGLIDEAGSDTYIMNNGLGQSGSHDYAASLLLDKAGNDRYMGNTSCNGAALTNSASIFIDRAGDDVYSGKRGSVNVATPARGFGSIGVMLDMGGTDDYLGLMRDDLIWSKDTTAMGIDIGDIVKGQIVAVEEAKEPGNGLWLEDNSAANAELLAANNAGFDKPSEGLKMPDEITYQGALDQAIFDKLWEIAIRWEVGDNRLIVPEARKRLIAFGPEVLPFIEAKMSDPNSLAIRGYVDVFKAFSYEPVTPTAEGGSGVPASGPQPAGTESRPTELSTIGAVRDLLSRQLSTGEIPRQQAALSVITELKLKGVGSAILPLLDSPDSGMQRRAIATLGAISDASANTRLVANLNAASQPDEALIKVSIEALCGMQVDCYGQLRELLGYPSITVREALFNQLVAQWPTYRIMVVSDYHNPDGLNLQAQRSLLRLLLAVDEKPTDGMLDDLRQYLASPDWGVRQDMIALWQKWSGLYYNDEDLQPWFTSMTGIDRDISGMLETTSAPLPERLEAPKP